MVGVSVTNSVADCRMLAWPVVLALTACLVAVTSGMVAAVTYTDAEPALRSIGLTLQHLRAVHETFAFAWVFLGGVAIVYFYLFDSFGSPPPPVRRRMVWHVTLWTVAGVGILVTLLAGRFTGREYLGYHPVFSALILAGWVLFAWNYFGQVGWRLKTRPAYIYMWSVGIVLFVITFLEGHLYLLDALSARPLRDIAVQWKSNGTMVGSFNMLAYGSLLYIAGRLRGDDGYAHSRTAFALLLIGVLNTFTNYGHHTYHLPQSPLIHWISFAVSMLETVILAKCFVDIVATRRTPRAAEDLQIPDRFVRSGMVWTFLMLVLALSISVPPLNALIHGTHVVVAHSMGSMIGIDSMILWAALSYVLWHLVGPRHPVVRGARVRAAVPLVNAFFFVLWIAFLARGVAAGWVRYAGPSAPDLSLVVQVFPVVMVVSGFGFGAAVLWILANWLIALRSVAVPARSLLAAATD